MVAEWSEARTVFARLDAVIESHFEHGCLVCVCVCVHARFPVFVLSCV
jgi:hypothetical protein